MRNRYIMTSYITGITTVLLSAINLEDDILTASVLFTVGSAWIMLGTYISYLENK
jgi:hypothetical protein